MITFLACLRLLKVSESINLRFAPFQFIINPALRPNTLWCSDNTLRILTQDIACFWHDSPSSQCAPCPSQSLVFSITHNDLLHSVGLLWTSDRPLAETSTLQRTTLATNIYAPGGIRAQNLSRRDGPRPMSQTARPLGPARKILHVINLTPEIKFLIAAVCVFDYVCLYRIFKYNKLIRIRSVVRIPAWKKHSCLKNMSTGLGPTQSHIQRATGSFTGGKETGLWWQPLTYV